MFILTDRKESVCCQVGCKWLCFLHDRTTGYVASLSAADILNQLYSLPEAERLTNIVFMGQGEPFDNLDAVLRVTEILMADWGYGWSPKRITVSSVGLSKGLIRFLEESPCHLAISLHHPIPEERAKIMPAERAFSIRDVVNVLKQYDFCRKADASVNYELGTKQRRLSFEYRIDGLNDSLRHADALLDLLKDLDCRVNLIRFHDIPDTPLRGVDNEQMTRFRDYLTAHGLFTTIRASRGQDIFAACGLLSTAQQEANKRQG
ncbi:MAG: radical SAM protein [Prevotellamassilia sp.]